MTCKRLLGALIASTLLIAAYQAMAQAKLVETVIRICARSTASVVSCWALQSGGGWAVDQALTAAWNRISGQPSSDAKAAPRSPPQPPTVKPPSQPFPGAPIDARATRLEPLEMGRLADALKGTKSLPSWVLDPQTKALVVHAPGKPPGQFDQLARDLNAHVGWKPFAQPAAPAIWGSKADALVKERAPAGSSAPPQLSARAPSDACRAERAQKAGLSLTMVVLAPPDQRTNLARRWNTEVVGPCEKPAGK